MRVLALEPYYGGSHRAFLDGWVARSAHEFTVLDLPPRKWKWRMRHAAVTFAEQATERVAAGARFDVIFCSDMLNVAEFRGLCPPALAQLPLVVYFHENQFTYPFRYQQERDLHFGFINMTSALAADAVWFNSAFHRDDFLAALDGALRKMPDYQGRHVGGEIRRKAEVAYPGVELVGTGDGSHGGEREAGPLHVLWVARWEHDKRPDTFFDAVERVLAAGGELRLSVIGEQFAEQPAVFAAARERFEGRIVAWGYQPSRAAYERVLRSADVVVSTADHEFFGLAVVEAVSAGALPLLPARLSYPELVADAVDPGRYLFADPAALVERLLALAQAGVEAAEREAVAAKSAMVRFAWPERVGPLDAGLEGVVRDARGCER